MLDPPPLVRGAQPSASGKQKGHSRPTSNNWALKTPQGRKIGSSLKDIEARQPPWWPGDIGNNQSKASGEWNDWSPVDPGRELRVGKPCVLLAVQPNLVFLPGEKNPVVALDYRSAKNLMSGQRADTAGITTYADLGPQDLKPVVLNTGPSVKRMLRKERTGKKMTATSELLDAKRDPGFINQEIDNMAVPIIFRLQGKCGVTVGLGMTDSKAPDKSTAKFVQGIQNSLSQEITRGHISLGAKLTSVREHRFCLPVKEAAATALAQAWVHGESTRPRTSTPSRGEAQSSGGSGVGGVWREGGEVHCRPSSARDDVTAHTPAGVEGAYVWWMRVCDCTVCECERNSQTVSQQHQY